MKGFIFTTDALFAVLVALLVVNVTALNYEIRQGGENYIPVYDFNTTDAAITGLYLGEDAIATGLKGEADTTRAYEVCSHYYEYQAANNSINNTSFSPSESVEFFDSQFWIKEKFCGGSP